MRDPSACSRWPRCDTLPFRNPQIARLAQLVGHADSPKRLRKGRDAELRLQHREASSEMRPATLFFRLGDYLDRPTSAVKRKIPVELVLRQTTLARLRKFDDLLNRK